MTPKETASEIVDKFYPIFTNSSALNDAKKCALISVDLILAEFYADVYYTEVREEILKITE